MKSLTEAQLRELMQAAYNQGWQDRTSYHEAGSNYWGNVTRSQHDGMLRDSRSELFTKLINEV